MKKQKIIMIASSIVVLLIMITVIEMTTHIFFRTIMGIPREWNKELGIIITEEKVKIPLPKGFKNAKVTNKIDEGIVIEDELGNQFVWVPTNDVGFERSTLGLDNTPLGYRVMLVEEDEKDIAWDVIKNPEIKTTTGGVWQPKETIYDGLIDSVEKYNGFYMGRYEASYRSGDSIKNYIPSEVKSTTATESDGTNKAGKLWNFVSANESYEIAKNMYEDNSTVVSHLPYGVEWDTVMKWLIETKNKTSDEIIKNSSSWGNTGTDTFSNTTSLINTGEFDETKGNNIYDMAGNLFEWTREYFGKDERAINRGGYLRAYIEEINSLSAGTRAWLTAFGNDQKFASVGFRVALYIK